MKENEAPEKIHISLIPSKFGGYVLTTVEKDFPNAIEYTRTDAFMEKAIKYIANHFLALRMDNEIEDFRKYMKGE